MSLALVRLLSVVCCLLVAVKCSSQEMEASAASALYPKMDSRLKQAFYTCFRNYRKISTKKLIASLVDPSVIPVADRVVALTEYAGVPPRHEVQVYEATADNDIAWLTSLRRGPGVSPCVMNTCSRLLGEANENEIDSLLFLQFLSDTAVELSRLVRQNNVNVPEMVAEARVEC